MSTLAELAAELANRSDAQLIRLFARRPDAINPPVANFAALATRLCGPSSIALALDTLNAPQLHALAALHESTVDAADHAATLRQLHELALLTATVPASKHDAGTRAFLPLTSVGLALGETPASAGYSAAPPAPEHVQLRAALRDNAAASAIETLLRIIAALVEAVGHTPLPALRDKSAGARTVRKLAAWLEIDEAQLCFYLELAAAVRLISHDPATAHWHAAAPEWLELERPAQWLVLVQAWQDSSRLPFSTAPGSAVKGSTVPGTAAGNTASRPAPKPLAVSSTHPHLPALRRRVLTALATPELAGPASNPEKPGTVAAPTADAVLNRLCWQHPRQTPAVSSLVPGILAELELLGLTGAGALSIPGQWAAAADWPSALAALDATLPAPIGHFVIQGDLTAVAPGFLAPAVAAELKLLATPEGRGAAGVFRFSEQSLQRAVAAGKSQDSILAFLRRHASTELPQSLEYLIGAAAKHPAAHAPPASPTRPSKRVHEETTAQPRLAPQPAADVVLAQLREQLARLRNNPVWSTADAGEAGPALVMEQLRTAIASGGSVWLRAVTGAGDIERVQLAPISLVGGLLRARLAGTGRERRFSIHRIMAVEQRAHEGTEL